MSRRSRTLAGLAVAAVVALGGWWLTDRALPLPAALAGEWENESRLFAAGPGEVRLTVARSGSVALDLDRRLVWRGADRFDCRAEGGRLIVRPLPDGEPVSLWYAVEGDRLRIWPADPPADGSGAIVFRRPG